MVALKNYIVKQNQFSRICLDLCLSDSSSHCLLTCLILNTLISIRTNTTISMHTKPRLTYIMTWARAALTRVLKRKFLSINIELNSLPSAVDVVWVFTHNHCSVEEFFSILLVTGRDLEVGSVVQLAFESSITQ